jgi:parvulin-like peptidyl-prolyl isomerase
VLVTYVGAEGASSNARTKAEALVVAQRLHDDAKTDFKKAVKEGDAGSLDDIGRIPRGVLDPRSEVAVFSLAASEISEILETPKGFWIVKRLD